MTERSSNSLPATPASVRRVLGGRRSSGIVTVVKRDSRDAGSSIEDDPEMQRLRQIPKVSRNPGLRLLINVYY